MKKIFIFILMILTMINLVSAIVIDTDIQDFYNSENISINLNTSTGNITTSLNDSYVYITMDDADISGSTILDISGNSLHFTNSGATTGVTGIINEALSFDGLNDQLTRSTNNNFDSTDSFSINVWFNNNDLSGEQSFITQRIASNNQWYFGLDNTELSFTYNDGSFHAISKIISYTNEWHMATITKSGSTLKLYIDGVLQTGTGTELFAGSNTGFSIGSSNGEDYFDGKLDEINLYTRVLSASEISDLYNYQNNSQIQYPFIVESSLINTNITYSLNGGSFIDICSNCNTTTLNLTSLNDSFYNITFNAITIDDEINLTENFTIDTTNPIINVSSFTEKNNYNVNFSSIVSCSDSNLDYCNITTDEGQTFSYTNESYTFLTNGNHTFNITAVDGAGNNATSNGSLFINPYAYFNFQYQNGTPINNYTFGGVGFNNTANFTLYNSVLNLGNNILLWEKFGFIAQNISFEVTNTSRINNTYNISDAIINVRIELKDDGSLVVGENFTLTFVATVGATGSTNTGLFNISNILFQEEQYQLTVTSDNYETESVFFNFNNEEELNITVSVINSTDLDLGFVVVKVVDKFGQPIPSQVTQSLQWDSSTSSYQKVGEALTDDAGNAIHNIILDIKQYIFRTTVDGQMYESAPQIISASENGKEIVIAITEGPTDEDYTGENLVYTVSESFNNNISNINFSFTNTLGTNVRACISYYRIVSNDNYMLISQNCTTDSSGTLEVYNFINSSYDIEARAEFPNEVIGVVWSKVYYGVLNIPNLIKETNIHYYILPLLYLLCILIAIKSVEVAGVSVIIVSGISLFIVPEFVTKTIVAFLMFCGGMLIYVGGKRK